MWFCKYTLEASFEELFIFLVEGVGTVFPKIPYVVQLASHKIADLVSWEDTSRKQDQERFG